MTDEYEKLPYIGKKRAKRLRDKGIGIMEIAQMSESELKSHLGRMANGKIRTIIATAREIAGRINDISISLSMDKEKAKILALNDYDLKKISKAKKEDIMSLLGIKDKEALDIIFKAALSTGVKRKEVKIKKEYVNGMGVVSKEGFINGFSQVKFVKRETVKVIPIIVVLIVIVSAIGVSLLFTKPKIKIDGNFSDWKDVKGYNINHINYKFNYYDGVLYFYLQKNDMFNDNEEIYLVVDNGEGGYYLHGIYANLVVEFYGWNNTLQGSGVWKYVSSKYLWNFTSTGGLVYSFKNSGIEGRLDNIKSSAKLVLIDKSDYYYITPPIVVSKKNVMVIQRNMVDVIGNNTPIYSIKIVSPTEFKLNAININVSGADIIYGNVSIDNMNYSGTISPGGIVFNINKKISSSTIVFSGIFSGRKSAPVNITAFLNGNGVRFSYYNETSRFYLFSPPRNVTIDGAFGDWRDLKEDIIGDVNDANIDLTNYSYTSDFTKVFMEVRGEIMGGDDIPIFHHWVPKDSDRDGVPDKYDLYPHDFNNDGIPDDQTHHDVDGDGFADYPYGNDTWLNTTIPYDFPSPYAGRHVSVYIGPPPPQKPKNGNDTAEIYFGNGDSMGAHLYWVPFIVDYKITITGRDGIYNASLFKYSSGHWIFEKKIKDIASGYHRMELSTGLNISNGRMWITIFNWNNQQDSPSLGTRTRASTTNDFYFHGIYDSYDFQNMNWTQGDNEQIFNLANSGDDVNWTYEHKITEKYYIQSATVYLYLKENTGGLQSEKYLNISLYAIHVSGNNIDKYSLLMYSDWIDVTQSDSSVHQITFSLDYVNNTTVYSGWYLVVDAVYYESFNDYTDSIDIYYNSTSYPSYLEINTNTTMKIVNVWTENDTSPTNIFKAGERVHIFANVTDPLGWQHIDSAEVDVSDYFGTVAHDWMDRVQNGFGYSIFEYNYTLPWNAYTGVYNLSVDAYDVEGYMDENNDGYFTLPGDLSFRPRYEKLFVPEGSFSAWFPHRIVNNGNGRDIYNFKVSSTGNFELTIYNDTNHNKVLDSGDVLLAKYNSGWTYKLYDNDSDGNPDIEVNMGAIDSIIIQDNVSLSSSTPTEEVDVTVYSNLGGITRGAVDKATIREVKIKTLYLKGGGDTNTAIPDTLEPSAPIGTVDNLKEIDGTTTWWNMTLPFANDFVIVGSIYVKVYIDDKPGSPPSDNHNITLTLDDGTYIGSATFVTTDKTAQWYNLAINPKISIIPAGRKIIMSWYADGKNDLHFNSTTYPSRIDFNTTSYIYVQWTKLYNATSMQLQSNYSAGDTIAIRSQIRDPFGAYDIKDVIANITDPNGTVSTFHMTVEYDNISYQVYRYDYTIPNNAIVGIYNVNITAIEGNEVKNYSETSFTLECNISISPHTNSSSGLIIWYNHTIWNNGSGRDLININLTSDANVNITLYHKTASGLELMAYSDTGSGWTWVNSSFDTDGDGNPDTGWLSSGSSFDIVVKVNTAGVSAGTQINTNVNINDISICSDSATDTSTAVPEMNILIIPILVFIPFLIRRRKNY